MAGGVRIARMSAGLSIGKAIVTFVSRHYAFFRGTSAE
jgi:hypothetical protein